MTAQTLLVTGGAGFIGKNFCQQFMETRSGHGLIVLDALTYAGTMYGLEQYLDAPGFRFVEGDIRDTELVLALLTENNIQKVVHFAAESHVDNSIADPDTFIDVNITGTHSLLKAARHAWNAGAAAGGSRLFCHVSTDEVFGTLDMEAPPFTEDTPYAPNSPYSASKAASDHLARAYGETYGLPVVITNCSNNFGPYQFPEKLIPLMTTNALDGLPLPVYGQGINVRDWIWVADHCAALSRIVDQPRPGMRYNIGGRAELRNIDLVRMLCAEIDSLFQDGQNLCKRFPHCPAARGGKCEELITFVADRPGHDLRYAIDCGRIERDYGVTPTISLSDGLKRTIAWYIDHEDWWRSLKARN